MQNIVTWGQNMSANIEEFACISMGGLFSGVPPESSVSPTAATKVCIAISAVHVSTKWGYWFPGIVRGGGVLTYLAERGCAALMGCFFTRNP